MPWKVRLERVPRPDESGTGVRVSAWRLCLGYATVAALIALGVLLELPPDPVGFSAALLLLATMIAHASQRRRAKERDWDRALARLLLEESEQRSH